MPAKDTIKPPLTRAPLVVDLSGGRYRWTRDSLFGTGALTVADLLDLVPGMTSLRAGWIGLPATGAAAGSVRGLRVIYDGLEITALDPRAGGIVDLALLQLWTLEEVLIERRATEVVVHMRSWRVARTTPYTRTDVGTGDVQTNLYRGLYGKRFDNGFAVQAAAQQYGMVPPSNLGTSSDQTSVMARVGWAGRVGSVDGFMLRVRQHRGRTLMDASDDSIPSVEGNRVESYLRFGRGDPDTARMWIQALAASSSYDFEGMKAKDAADSVSADTTVQRAQYVLSGGTNIGRASLTATARYFDGAGAQLLVPSLGAGLHAGRFDVSAWLDGKGVDSLARAGAAIAGEAVAGVRYAAAAEHLTDYRRGSAASSTNYRATASYRVRDVWLSGGMVRRDAMVLAAPLIFNLGTDTVEAAATGYTAALEGRVWRGLRANVSAIRWNDTAGFYRPQYQVRSEVGVRTQLLHRFPRGNFGLVAVGTHEYRSATLFPLSGGVARAAGYRSFGTLLEIRVNTAVVSWQFRNIRGEVYHQVPGYRAPRGTNFYGVRWEFWN